MIDFGVGVILPAAGSGVRMGIKTPKQYSQVLDKPLFMHALEEFNAISWITNIALVVDNVRYVQTLLTEQRINQDKISVVLGDRTRHRSIRIGLNELYKLGGGDARIRVVVVHDAVRPLVERSLVETLVLAALAHGAAGCTRPLVSTVIASDPNGFFQHSLQREHFLASETPQAFLMDTLANAYHMCTDEELDHGTECLQLVFSYTGTKAKLLEGPSSLWKVTHRKDLHTAIGCIREKYNTVCIIGPEDSLGVRHLSEVLLTKVPSLTVLSATVKPTIQDSYTSIVMYHVGAIEVTDQMLSWPTSLDYEKPGLVVHVVESTHEADLRAMTAYDLHQSGRDLERRHLPVKSVVTIHWISHNYVERMTDLVATLITGENKCFTGQVFIV